MLKVYLLAVVIQNGFESVEGIDLIHDAILETVEDTPSIRRLIMDTNTEEHNALSALADTIREPTLEELELFESLEPTPPPDPNYVRACELLETSPAVITMPEMWEILRIFGRHLGYRF